MNANQLHKLKIFLFNKSVKSFIRNDKLLVKCTWLIGLSFAVSALLNFILSRIIVVTEPSVDKIAFNDEVGQMMGWSLPVISIPCMVVSGYAFWLLIKGIRKFTGLSMEEVMAQAPQNSGN